MTHKITLEEQFKLRNCVAWSGGGQDFPGFPSQNLVRFFCSISDTSRSVDGCPQVDVLCWLRFLHMFRIQRFIRQSGPRNCLDESNFQSTHKWVKLALTQEVIVSQDSVFAATCFLGSSLVVFTILFLLGAFLASRSLYYDRHVLWCYWGTRLGVA